MKISRRRLILGIALAAAVASALAIWWMVREHQEQSQAFLTVKEGVLYRSRQPDPMEGGKLSRLGITQVVNLRGRFEDEGVFDREEAVCRQAGVKFVNIPIGAVLPSDAQVETFLRLVVANRGATLVHCQKGKSRTGAMVASYRIVVEGWKPARAMEELLRLGDKSDAENLSEKEALFQRLFKERQAWLGRIHKP
jgi:protein tyrosine/serine phosphatase